MELKFIRLDKLNFQSPFLRKGAKTFEELKASIKSRGLIVPVEARPLGKGEYVIIDGNRRIRALIDLGYKPSFEVPVLVVDTDDTGSVERSLMHNLVREEFEKWDAIEGINLLVNSYGKSQKEVAASLGKSKSLVSKYLSLFSLPKYVIAALRKRKITPRHGLLLLKLKDQPERLRRIFDRVIKERTSIEELEVLIASEQLPYKFFAKKVKTFKDGSRIRVIPRKETVKVEITYVPGGKIKSILKELKETLKGIKS